MVPASPSPPNVAARDVVQPSADLVPFTCPWAQDGLRRAMEGMIGVATGTKGYGIGSRWVRYRDAAEQASVVDYWQKMVEYYCGADALPSSITGRDTACRIIPRDV